MIKVNENIFRAYDIRGIYGEELDEKTSYYIGVAFGQNIKNKGKNKAIIAYDNRLSSIPLSESLINGITDVGVDIINIGLATSPMFYYAREYFEIPSGIVITASHSPSQYNGMKIALDEEGCIYGEMIQSFKEEVKHVINNFESTSKGRVENIDIKEAYLKMLREKITLGNRKIKVAIDCGNGTGSIVAEEVFKQAGCEIVPLYCDSNPEFPNHHPDPAVEKNMEDLKKLVVSCGADLGIGFDGDADRIGIIDEQGKMIYSDMFMAIIWRDLMPKLTDKRALIDIKCSKALEDEIVKLGGKAIYNRTGHSYMKKAMKEQKFAFGGELSGHVFFADEFYGYDDAMYAGLRLIRILSNTDKPLSALLEGINKYYSTPEIMIRATDESKFNIIDEVIEYAKGKGYNMLTLDGARVLFDDGWALIRASNTGPNLTTRFEAISEERLNDIKEEFQSVLTKILEKYQIN
ncbi:MAG: phosphomannomutase/phosphoglucomutase [Bacilli bacterium]|nr:phosphomannomutase/phosphoglucomutase [Bacilli bacterium]